MVGHLAGRDKPYRSNRRLKGLKKAAGRKTFDTWSDKAILPFTSFPFSGVITGRAYGLGRSSRPPPTPTESHQTRCTRRRHCLGQPPRNAASNSRGRLRSGVDLFGRASRGYIANLKICRLCKFLQMCSRGAVHEQECSEHSHILLSS